MSMEVMLAQGLVDAACQGNSYWRSPTLPLFLKSRARQEAKMKRGAPKAREIDVKLTPDLQDLRRDVNKRGKEELTDYFTPLPRPFNTSSTTCPPGVLRPYHSKLLPGLRLGSEFVLADSNETWTFSQRSSVSSAALLSPRHLYATSAAV